MKQLIRAGFYTVLCGIAITLSLTACDKANNTATETVDCYHLADSLHLIEVVDSPDLTAEMLESRNGKILIERVIGEVLNDNWDGAVFGVDPNYNYISYRNVKGVDKGDVILTYLVYNPDNNYVDDIVARYDYVIGNK